MSNMIFWNNEGHTMAKTVVDFYAQRAKFETEDMEIIRTQKMYDYMKNDSAAIRYHLRDYLSKIMNEKTLANMPLVWLNEVPRIINRRCLVYKKPAIRRIEPEEKQEEYDNFKKQFNKFAKEMHKRGKLFNTVLVRPLFSKEKQIFEYLILARNIADVDMMEDDPTRIKELRYQINYSADDDKGTVNTAIIHWTEEKNWATDTSDRDVTNKLSWMPEDKKNPYGKIPFETLRFEDCADFWGDGMPDLVEGQEALNGRLSDLFYKRYMSFGQAVGTNLGIKKEDFSIGYDKPILRDNVRNDNNEAPPSLEFITPEHDTEMDQLVNDWYMNKLSNTKGLPSNGIRYSSGYEREVDNLELLDLNEDDQEILRDFEERLFDLEKIVLKVDAKKDYGDAKITVEFAKMEFPLTETEVWAKRNEEYKYNISTPADWLIEKRPGLDRKEAMKIIMENKKEIEEILPKAKSKLTDIINKQQTEEPQ